MNGVINFFLLFYERIERQRGMCMEYVECTWNDIGKDMEGKWLDCVVSIERGI